MKPTTRLLLYPFTLAIAFLGALWIAFLMARGSVRRWLLETVAIGIVLATFLFLWLVTP